MWHCSVDKVHPSARMDVCVCLRSHESSECAAVGGRARVSVFCLFKAVFFSFLPFLSFGDSGSAAGAPDSPCQTEGSSLKELTEPVARRLLANRARVCPSDVKRRPSHRRQEDGAWETQTQADSLTGSRVPRDGLLRCIHESPRVRQSRGAEQRSRAGMRKQSRTERCASCRRCSPTPLLSLARPIKPCSSPLCFSSLP